MKKYRDILDNDKRLTSLGWEAHYHRAIHLPEQIMMAYQSMNTISPISSPKKEVFIYDLNEQTKLLITLLKCLYDDKLKINRLEDISKLSQIDPFCLIIIPDYYQDISQIPDLANVIYLAKKSSQTGTFTSVNFAQIPVNEPLGIFFGWLVHFLDKTFCLNNHVLFNKLIAFLMQKAGVVAWRLPFDQNYAKHQAVTICEAGSCLITTLNCKLKAAASYWQHCLQKYAQVNSSDLNLIKLQSLKDEPTPEERALLESIFADGENEIQMLFSLYYLVNAIAVYIALIKNIRYKEDKI